MRLDVLSDRAREEAHWLAGLLGELGRLARTRLRARYLGTRERDDRLAVVLDQMVADVQNDLVSAKKLVVRAIADETTQRDEAERMKRELRALSRGIEDVRQARHRILARHRLERARAEVRLEIAQITAMTRLLTRLES